MGNDSATYVSAVDFTVAWALIAETLRSSLTGHEEHSVLNNLQVDPISRCSVADGLSPTKLATRPSSAGRPFVHVAEVTRKGEAVVRL